MFNKKLERKPIHGKYILKENYESIECKGDAKRQLYKGDRSNL